MKVLLVGDAVVATGFSRVTHAYATGLIRAGHQVRVLGVNYSGDPHPYGYPIHTCFSPGDAIGYRKDPLGFSRLAVLAEGMRPDAIVAITDVWYVDKYATAAGSIPLIASVAVDGKNCRGRALGRCKHVIFWTEFGQQEAQLGGFDGPCSVIPLGVDATHYRPLGKTSARAELNLPEKALTGFVVGAAGRNHQRKRMDLTVMYFAEWVKVFSIPDAYLLLHVAPTGDLGYNLRQLVKYYGVDDRLLYSEPSDVGSGATQETLRTIYSAMDAFLCTAQGEGFGLCVAEAMACGVVPIVPQWAALSEWPGDAAIKVPCSSFAVTPAGLNVIGGIMDAEKAIEALNLLYGTPRRREELSEAAIARMREPQFSWDDIGARVARVVESVGRAA